MQMFAKLDKYGFAVTLVHIMSCKVKENIEVNYETGMINIGFVQEAD